MKICPKCNEENKTNGKFCSRKCANSRGPRSEDFKNKVRQKLVKTRLITTCIECGDEFEQKRSHNSSKLCSRKCLSIKNNRLKKIYGISKETKEKISSTRKMMFAQGLIGVTGGTTKWITYRDIKVQGSYEYRTCVVLDKWKELNLIEDWEYTNERITYTNNDGNSATYILDFKIITNENKTIFLETKGFIRENDELKWEMCKTRSMNLKVWFIQDIEKAEKIINISEVFEILR